MAERNKALLRKFIEQVWNNGEFQDIERFVEFPYTIRHDPGDPWETKSLDCATFKERVLYFRHVFPDLHFSLHEVIAEDDKVVISWYFQGTHKGDIKGFLAATGKKVNVSGMTIYDFSEGKITGHWQVVDRMTLIEQLRS
jgi:steroid delta-isomerase-like uncharacterized protein